MTFSLRDDLQKGDLLFQLCTGGEVEWIISRLFAGYNGMALNHVGMYLGDNQLIESIMPRVWQNSLDNFLRRSVLDGNRRPCVMVARVAPEYQHLIDAAVDFAQQQLQQPYNPEYLPARTNLSKQRSWYCSALILEAFRAANNDTPIFPETPMGFRDLETGELFPYWIELYQRIGQPVPEGEPGSHPALLSCSDKLQTIHILGQLPARQSSWTNMDRGTQLT